MKARRDVPSYRSWVFPLQTAVRMMEAESAPATFSSPSPPSFLPSSDWIRSAHPFVFLQDVAAFMKTVAAMTGVGVWLLPHTLHIPTFPIFVLENEVTLLLVRLLFSAEALQPGSSSQCVLLPSSVSTVPTWPRFHHVPAKNLDQNQQIFPLKCCLGN